MCAAVYEFGWVREIPANVAQAVNFCQPEGLLHGQAEIRAADPTQTNILGNCRFDYKASAYNCGGYPWYDRFSRNLTPKSSAIRECRNKPRL